MDDSFLVLFFKKEHLASNRAGGRLIHWIAALLFACLPLTAQAQPASVATTIGDLSVVKLYPVIFSGGFGAAGPNEYNIALDGSTINVEIPAAPAGFRLLDTFWQPYDNLAAVAGFAQIVVAPGNDSAHLLLTAKPYPGARTRLRLVITALYVRDHLS
jgi:hypothetical protein